MTPFVAGDPETGAGLEDSMTTATTSHTAPAAPEPSAPIASLGLGPDDLLLPPLWHRGTIAGIESREYGPDEMEGPTEVQIWTFRVTLPSGSDVLFSDIGDYNGEYDNVVGWTDALLDRPCAYGDGKMPNAEERQRLIGMPCAIRFELHCSAPPWLPGQRDHDIVRFPGGCVFAHKDQRVGWWTNVIEDVRRPDDVDERDFAGFGYRWVRR